MILNRTYPATPITLNRKQLLEMNILLLQAFFPQEFTDKEREILLQYLLCLDESLSIHDKEVKLRVTEKCKLKSTASLNVYNERLRDKQASKFYTQKTFYPVKGFFYGYFYLMFI